MRRVTTIRWTTSELRVLPCGARSRLAGVRSNPRRRWPNMLRGGRYLHTKEARWTPSCGPAALEYPGSLPKVRPRLPAADSLEQDRKRHHGSRREQRGLLWEANTGNPESSKGAIDDIRGASTRDGHPAPYPVEVAERLIKMFSFAGHGLRSSSPVPDRLRTPDPLHQLPVSQCEGDDAPRIETGINLP